MLAATLAPRIAGVVDRAVARARSELARYAEIPAEELRDGILADLGRAMAALLEERPLTDQERQGMGSIGDARAREGIPLESMLQVYRFTIDEIFGELWQAAEDGALTHAEVVALTREIWRYADPAMDLAVQAYRERELAQAIAHSQGRTAIVHALLLGPTDATTALELAARSGITADAEHVAFRARHLGGDQHALLLDLQTPGVLEQGLVAPHEGDVIGIARRKPAVGLPSVIIGVGPSVPLDQLQSSLSVAGRVVEAATRHARPGIHTIDDVALEAIVGREPLIAARLQARFVKPCQPGTPRGEELLATIEQLLAADLSVEGASEQLFVHANTVRNRLRRFEQLTGADLRRVDDVIGVRLALLARTAAAPPPASRL